MNINRNILVGSLFALAALTAPIAEAADQPQRRSTASPGSMAAAQGLAVTSSSFRSGEVIPKRFTADGPDVSPELSWSAVPSGTKSIAIICDDPDAPRGRWYHWLIWNLPANTTSINENVPKTGTVFGVATQGTNDFGKLGYNGPAPPAGHTHHYHYRVLALDTTLSLKPGAGKQELLSATRSHIIGEGELVGIYWRR